MVGTATWIPNSPDVPLVCGQLAEVTTQVCPAAAHCVSRAPLESLIAAPAIPVPPSALVASRIVTSLKFAAASLAAPAV